VERVEPKNPTEPLPHVREYLYLFFVAWCFEALNSRISLREADGFTVQAITSF